MKTRSWKKINILENNVDRIQEKLNGKEQVVAANIKGTWILVQDDVNLWKMTKIIKLSNNDARNRNIVGYKITNQKTPENSSIRIKIINK